MIGARNNRVKATAVSQSLPPPSRVELRAASDALREATLARADAAVVMLPASEARSAIAKLPNAALWQRLYQAGRRAETAPVLHARLSNRRATLMVVGFVPDSASAFQRLALAGRMMREALKPGVAELALHTVGLPAAESRVVLEALATAALAGAAPMPSRRSKAPPRGDLRRLTIGGRGLDLDAIAAEAEGNHLARWLATLPPNELDSAGYRRALRELATREGWSFRFYDERSLRRLGAGAFLAVSRANDHRAAGIVRLRYRPRGRALRRIALVGKGICFDTGGINLKTHRSMYLMHGDMQGSAVAVGTLLALMRRRMPVEVDCWLAITENQTGPRAYRPQEIVRAANGVTIQVVHSDAEGRMVLADTLALAARERPALLLDFATLTGACVNALTERYSGAFTNRPELHEDLQRVGRSSGERVWCFPMDEDYDTDLESSIADVLQCAVEGKGDHILAARFLNRFVPGTLPWVHLDLSASDRKGGLAHVPTEFTGFGVRYASRLLADPAFVRHLDGRR
jgi:leucyl aminopeptidase